MSEPETDPRRYAQAAAVTAARFEVPAVAGDWDTGMLRVVADPARLAELLPLRRGPVQGAAVQGPAAQGPAVRGDGDGDADRSAPGAADLYLGREDLWWPAVEDSASSQAAATADVSATQGPKATPRPKPVSGARSSTAMAAVTVLSRFGSMAAQLLQAAALGSGMLATTFTVGNTLPNMIYFLIIGGALNAVFMPQLVAAMHRDPDGGAAYVDRLLTLVICALSAVTVVATVAAPWIVAVPARHLDPVQRALAVSFARYCMPQIFFYGVFAVVGQVLGARGRFGAAAWAPVANNVVVVAVFAGFIAVGGGLGQGSDHEPVLSAAQTMAIGVGTTVGVVVQALVVVWFLIGSGVRFRPRFDWRGAGLGQAGSLAKWTLAYMLVGQAVNILVMSLAAGVDQAHPDAGVGYAAYSKAQQIWILPQSVITVSLLTMLLPRMSRAAADDDPAGVRDDLSLGLRVSGAAIVPCAFAFLALGPQFAAVLFGYGHTTVPQTHGIGYMLAASGLGLIPFSAQYVILRGFYAFGDTRTPFTIGLITGAVNAAIAITASATLGGTRWPVVVMAGGTGLSSAVGLAWSIRRLRPRLAGSSAARPGHGVWRVYRRLLLAAAVAAAVGYAAAQDVGALVGGERLGSMLAAAAGGSALVVVYVLAAKALRVTEVDHLTRRVRSRVMGLIPRTG
ncbi:murein biosynthesis integral membrane protein MurJ [Catenulispora pinisilvae]|uniref:murein biosynthesis integral membrane protein MurJ n=1 Tax=Catenulispora pinisilvae TaxID=2705253 RepID=UPI002B2672EA|nr:murein biosynthesis integral membrane protein MurJ [Catenulispora pinisilvae]